MDNLPNNITYLKFGAVFNQSVDNLPDSITFLNFGLDFNQHINKLPQSIKKISFMSNEGTEFLENSLKHYCIFNSLLTRYRYILDKLCINKLECSCDENYIYLYIYDPCVIETRK